MTSLTLLIIRLQTTTLQEKVGHSYYYIQFNSHAHPFTYYPSQKQQNMSPNKLKCKKQQKKKLSHTPNPLSTQLHMNAITPQEENYKNNSCNHMVPHTTS